jgi:hypothetical protein
VSDVSLALGEDLTVAWQDLGEGGWALDGALAPSHSALRVLTAKLEDGVLVLASARPANADAHDAEVSAAQLIEGDKRTDFGEILLSTQYDKAGSVRRVGLELYPEDDDYPSRGAGDVVELSRGSEDGHEIATLEFRLGGRRGTALYEIIRP